MSRLEDRNALAMKQSLDTFRQELAATEQRIARLESAFRTLMNHYEVLESLLRHMQAEQLGHGPTIR